MRSLIHLSAHTECTGLSFPMSIIVPRSFTLNRKRINRPERTKKKTRIRLLSIFGKTNYCISDNTLRAETYRIKRNLRIPTNFLPALCYPVPIHKIYLARKTVANCTSRPHLARNSLNPALSQSTGLILTGINHNQRKARLILAGRFRCGHMRL